MTDMTTVKVSEATGLVLDYLVAMARHRDSPQHMTTNHEVFRKHAADLGYTQGHIEHVIQHMPIEVGVIATIKDCQTTKLAEKLEFQRVYPYHKGLTDNLLPSEIRGQGGTIAVLRAYVAKHLGDDVDVPAILFEDT